MNQKKSYEIIEDRYLIDIKQIIWVSSHLNSLMYFAMYCSHHCGPRSYVAVLLGCEQIVIFYALIII